MVEGKGTQGPLKLKIRNSHVMFIDSASFAFVCESTYRSVSDSLAKGGC